jgi:ATP-dependent HslUV protease subunit HslV
MASDGQVTHGAVVLKHQASKIRRLYHEKVLAGFAGSAADGLALCARLEGKLEEFGGNLSRAAVELAKDWRMDKYLRHLEAMLVVADKERTFLISGKGDLIEPDEGAAAVGSGAPYAIAAAHALVRHAPSMSAETIVRESMGIAARLCIYTNEHFTVEIL